MKIAFLLPGRLGGIAQELADVNPDIEIVHAVTSEALRPHLPDIDGLVFSPSTYTEELYGLLVAAAKKLRWLQAMSSGVDAVTAIGVPPGVTLTSASGVHANAVADHAMALLLGLMRGIDKIVRLQAGAAWKRETLDGVIALEGRRVLVPGYGPIGKGVARRLVAADAEVIAFNRAGGESGLEGVRLEKLADLEACLPAADAVVLCLPGAPNLDGLLGRAQLAALRPHALVVNVGRGSLIDLEALTDALATGRLGGAGLDVFEPEPLPDGHRLWGLPNVILSPHVAGGGGLTYQHHRELVGDNIRRFKAGTPLRNRFLPSSGQ